MAATADRAAGARAPGFRSVLRRREFRLLWLADAQSLLGDQLARVALAVLVFDRTGSGLATAAVYALTFLPALVGSVLLGHLADVLPRRALLVGGDLARAVLVAVMALPGVPLWLLAVLLVGVVVIGTPWKAAESALVADIVAGDEFVVGSGLRTATLQSAQLLGFGAGGLVVAALSPHGALALDALTFAASALLIRVGVHARPPAAAAEVRGRGRWWRGARAVFARPALRVLLGLSWTIGLLVVPEGLAAPYAAALHAGPAAVGLLLAAGPAGVLVGSLVFVRLVPARARGAALGPLAMAAGLPLAACLLHPGLALSLALWALSGTCLAYQVQVVTEFMAAVPAALRGQGIALASSGLLAAQGVGLLLGGVVAQVAPVTTAVGGAGLAAVVVAGALTRRRSAQRTSVAGAPA